MADPSPWLEPQTPAALYISYATRENTAFIQSLEGALRAEGYQVKRDTSAIGSKDSIGAFMAEMGQADCIVVILSDAYLPTCNSSRPAVSPPCLRARR